ncbi:MAG TPA: TolC family protein, partial [Gemmatimonadaceae bacterium]|nr:TolC family protein [Gemmatimonadaceae bacterium]
MRLIALIAISAQAAFAQQSPSPSGSSLSLDDAIAIARQNNPGLAQTKNLVRDADASVRTAYGALLPSASASIGSSYTQGGPEYYQNVSLGDNPASYNSSYRVGFGYNLSAAALYVPRAARANVSASQANVVSQSEALRANVTTQYIQALEQQATAALNDTLVTSAKGQLDLANAKMEVGAGTILDVRTAEVTLGQAQVAALQAHNQARIEKVKLFQLLGVKPDPDAQLTTKFDVISPPASLDSLISLAQHANPDVAAKKSTLYADEMQVKVARSSYLPSLSLSTGVGGTAFGYASVDPLVTEETAQAAGSYASCLSSDSLRVGAGLSARGCSPGLSASQVEALRQGLNASNKPFKFTSTPLSFSAAISLPIFNNFQRESNIETARVARDNANYDLKARDLQLTSDVTTAYLNVVTAAKTIELSATTAQQATEALAFAEESYKVGAKTFLD